MSSRRDIWFRLALDWLLIAKRVWRWNNDIVCAHHIGISIVAKRCFDNIVSRWLDNITLVRRCTFNLWRPCDVAFGLFDLSHTVHYGGRLNSSWEIRFGRLGVWSVWRFRVRRRPSVVELSNGCVSFEQCTRVFRSLRNQMTSFLIARPSKVFAPAKMNLFE